MSTGFKEQVRYCIAGGFIKITGGLVGKDKGWAGLDSIVARLEPDPAPLPEPTKSSPSEGVQRV